MCAIVDNNVANEVFGGGPPEAGRRFRHWLGGRNGRLVVGGRLLAELKGNRGFREWFQQNELSGRLLRVKDEEVAWQESNVKRTGLCTSDDEHVVALAIASGARLLYTNDNLLMDDFRNQQIVSGTRGRIYTTREHKDFRPAHRPATATDHMPAPDPGTRAHLGTKNLRRAPERG